MDNPFIFRGPVHDPGMFFGRTHELNEIAAFLRGSRMLTTLPGLLGSTMLHGFESCPTPVDCPPMPMYMIWHMRYRHDPVHAWLRQALEDLVSEVLSSEL